MYSSEVKKTEVLMENFRRSIGLRIKETKEVYEGEVTELNAEEVEGNGVRLRVRCRTHENVPRNRDGNGMLTPPFPYPPARGNHDGRWRAKRRETEDMARPSVAWSWG